MDEVMRTDESARDVRAEQLIRALVFVGFNSRVVALSQATGEIVWQWKSPKGTAPHVALLLDGTRLIVSIQGYTYCLDPLTGEQLWWNPLKGFGVGIPSLVSAAGSSDNSASAASLTAQQAAAANAAHPPVGP
jgi:outer membrane protein assembly factor BamB